MQPIANYHQSKASSGYMLTSEHIRELQNLIRERESVLHAKMVAMILQRTGCRTSDLKTSARDELVQSVAEQREMLSTSTLTEGAEELLALKAARERLKDNSYGLCIVCHGPIGFERLLALPTAQRCITCQELHEWGALDHFKTKQ